MSRAGGGASAGRADRDRRGRPGRGPRRRGPPVAHPRVRGLPGEDRVADILGAAQGLTQGRLGLRPAPGAEVQSISLRPSSRTRSRVSRTDRPLSRATRRISSNSGVTVITRPSRRETLKVTEPRLVARDTISRGGRTRSKAVHPTPLVWDARKTT